MIYIYIYICIYICCLDAKSEQNCRGLEKLLFLQNRSTKIYKSASLISSGLGGVVRFWNICSGTCDGVFRYFIVHECFIQEPCMFNTILHDWHMHYSNLFFTIHFLQIFLARPISLVIPLNLHLL